jgi:aminodeoxyfutalosine deaminase
MESIEEFIDELPKAELHLHLVGSASVPTVLELARRHSTGGVVPRTEPELRAFFEFQDFPHFAEVYGAVSALVREPADIAALVAGAARDLAGQNVRYAELTVTPHTFTKEGMPAAEVTEALDIGAAAAQREHGVRIGYVWPAWRATGCRPRSWTPRPRRPCSTRSTTSPAPRARFPRKRVADRRR